MEIEYRNISEAEAYRVGSDGSIWSCRRRGRFPAITNVWRKLKPYNSPDGYLLIDLMPKINTNTKSVHVLVLKYFVGPRPLEMEACHLDGNRKNNQLQNLQWNTKKVNMSHKILHGTDSRGERSWSHILVESEVLDIYKRIYLGESRKDIAEYYGVSPSAISNIKSGKSWNWMVSEYKDLIFDKLKSNIKKPKPKTLPDSQILEIRKKSLLGYTDTYLSKEYNTSRTTVFRIKNKTTLLSSEKTIKNDG